MPKLIIRCKDAPRRNGWERFFRWNVKAPTFAIQFPVRCPHCMGDTEREIAIWTKRVTGSNKEAHLSYRIPVCKAVREPIWQQLFTIVMAFVAVVVGTASAFQASWIGGGVALGAALLGARAWRAQRWVRFVWFDEDHYVFKARRRDWLEAFADANRHRRDLEVELR